MGAVLAVLLLALLAIVPGARSAPAEDGAPEVVRWQMQTLLEVADSLLTEGQDELARAVLTAGAARLALRSAESPGIVCPGSPSALGVFLASIKRDMVLAQALLDRNDSEGAARLLQSTLRPLSAYIRFSSGPRHDAATALDEALREALGSTAADAVVGDSGPTGAVSSAEVEQRRAALSSLELWKWLGHVELWCHRREQSGNEPGAAPESEPGGPSGGRKPAR